MSFTHHQYYLSSDFYNAYFSNMKQVAILVVTYNRQSLLKECVESLRSQTYGDRDIIVVNNGSTDGTLDWLREQHDIITITQGNLGGAGGFYTGLKYIAENGYKYCWLMDDDVICRSDALQQLMEAVRKYPDSGFICSKVVDVDGKSVNVPSVDDRSKDGHYPDWLDKLDEHLLKVKAASFVSVLIPIEKVCKVGLPIKEYFIWGDDAEYTMRLSLKSDCYLAYDSVVVHKRTINQMLGFMTETNPARLKNWFYMLRNSYANARKYGRAKDVFVTLCYHASLLFRSLARFDFKRIGILLRVFVSYFTFAPKVHYVDIKDLDR